MISNIFSRLKQGQFVLIAEIGVNYYDIAQKLNISLLEAAKLMVLSAKNAGIHAVKFQTYKAENLASKHSPSYWDTNEEPTNSQFELFKKFDKFGENEYKELSIMCNKIGIEFLSTPFDFDSVDYLNEYMSVYKISSSDLNNLSFIEYIAKKNKPVILSTGASELKEIEHTVALIQQYNNKPLILLHCVLEYPTPYSHANLLKIKSLKKTFPNTIIGYSDHTKPDVSYDVIKTAYLLGANIVEKHFTLDKKLSGNDHYHAMDVEDAKCILEGIEFIEKLKGTGELRCLDSEQVARKNARRSIVAAIDIPIGTKITREMLTFKRPGIGMTADRVNEVINATTRVYIHQDELINEDMLS